VLGSVENALDDLSNALRGNDKYRDGVEKSRKAVVGARRTLHDVLDAMIDEGKD